MKKQYALGNDNWTWNSEVLRWSKETRKNAVQQAMKALDPRAEWKTWSEFLFLTWKDLRHQPRWDTLKAQHDDEDNAYFDMLDRRILGLVSSSELMADALDSLQQHIKNERSIARSQ